MFEHGCTHFEEDESNRILDRLAGLEKIISPKIAMQALDATNKRSPRSTHSIPGLAKSSACIARTSAPGSRPKRTTAWSSTSKTLALPLRGLLPLAALPWAKAKS